MFRENKPFLLLYGAVFVFAYAIGFRVDIPYHFVQLLDIPWLEGRFWQSIYNLHSQPPLLNFMLGVLLWLKRLTGVRTEVFVLAMNFLLGFVITAAVATLSKSMVKNRAVSTTVVVLFLLNPYLYTSAFTYFYTFHELVLMSLIGVFVYRYFREPGPGSYACICLAMTGLVYTHSLFHFLWPLPILFALPLLMRRRPGMRGTNLDVTLVLAGVTVIVLLAWPMKNYERFGYFGYSSWQGLAFTTKEVFMPMAELPPGFAGMPELAEMKRSDGSTNWNQYSIIPFSRWLQSQYIQEVISHPGLIPERALFFYLEGYTLYEGRSTWTGKMYASTTAIRIWQRAYELLTFQHFGEFKMVQGEPKLHTSFVWLFPLIVITAGVNIVRQWKSSPAEAMTAAVMIYCILWILAMALLVNGFEGNRYRFCTEPFTIILAGWVLTSYKRSRTKTLIMCSVVFVCIVQGAVNWALWG